ncbi:MAG TPA: alkaline phosphatase family protein [Modestobacter sp.]|jgi:acid phosphatase|nr:alkaline phosphatase family protein [Modestobacter sp.]
MAGLTLVAACTSGGGQTSAAGSAEPPGSSAEAPAAGSSPPATGSPPAGLPRPDHVVVAVFENKNAAGVLGTREAAYLTSLARTGATFTDAHAETHPSQPNYLALFSGSTQGVTDDDCLSTLPGPDLGSQLLDAGLSFVGWAEGLPRAGYTGCGQGGYARKHNPWVNFADLPASVNQPLSAMPTDYGQLPTVSFVVPDLCNDMHDCGVAAGDAWAKEVLDPYVSWARDHNSLLLVTFDEDDGSSDNHIATFLVGADVQATSTDQRIDHYDLLRTLEEMYGLPPLGKAADARPITDVWSTTPG